MTRPRVRQNEGGYPTAAPHRSDFPLRDGLPEQADPQRSVAEQHWRKHPSDYHADIATTHLTKASAEKDSARRRDHLLAADANASLSLRDAVLELSATLRELRGAE